VIKTILESIVKIITVIIINILFIFIYGYSNFEFELLSKLNYVVYAGFIVITLLMTFEYYNLFKNYYLSIIIKTIINTILVVMSSIVSLSIIFLLTSGSIDINKVLILIGLLIGILILTIITLIFIDKKEATIK
jgi:hypothetical protein